MYPRFGIFLAALIGGIGISVTSRPLDFVSGRFIRGRAPRRSLPDLKWSKITTYFCCCIYLAFQN